MVAAILAELILVAEYPGLSTLKDVDHEVPTVDTNGIDDVFVHGVDEDPDPHHTVRVGIVAEGRELGPLARHLQETFGDRAFVGPVAELLAPLLAPHSVFAVLGNHDDDRDMPAALSQRHIEVLKNARTRLDVRGERLELAGVRFWTRRPQDVARVLRDAADPVILLAHDPRRLTEASTLNVPTVLSGHTHGGQVVLPGSPVPCCTQLWFHS